MLILNLNVELCTQFKFNCVISNILIKQYILISNLLFLDYYELVNEIVNNISDKSNLNLLAKLKNINIEKNELFKTAKINAREARYLYNNSRVYTFNLLLV